jgi:hypothetical protein
MQAGAMAMPETVGLCGCTGTKLGNQCTLLPKMGSKETS